MQTKWLICQTLDGTWWYEDLFTGAKLPPGIQPICKYPGNPKEIKIPRLDISKIRDYRRNEDGD